VKQKDATHLHIHRILKKFILLLFCHYTAELLVVMNGT